MTELGCVFRASKIVEDPVYALQRCFQLDFKEASDGTLEAPVCTLLQTSCGQYLVAHRIVLLNAGTANLTLSAASKLFSNAGLWTARCQALSTALQRHISNDGYLKRDEREEIEALHETARKRARRARAKFASSSVALENAPPCVSAVLNETLHLKNDARYHLGTICAELTTLVGKDVVEHLVGVMTEVITEKHGAHRGKHFAYHANRPSFNRKCVTMANAPVKCTASPELCMKERGITTLSSESLSPSIVWAHKRI